MTNTKATENNQKDTNPDRLKEKFNGSHSLVHNVTEKQLKKSYEIYAGVKYEKSNYVNRFAEMSSTL